MRRAASASSPRTRRRRRRPLDRADPGDRRGRLQAGPRLPDLDHLASAWWPPEHTASHERDAEIVFEPRVGGRIFERTSAGQEIDWGHVTEWDPPRRLRYQWHIAADRADATDVEIVFRELAGSLTRVEIEHRGWEGLGVEKGRAWRDVNHGGWGGVLPAHIGACSKQAA